MRIAARKLLSYVLVALYGSVSLLGYGLHELAPESGHHHGFAAIEHEAHSCGHAHTAAHADQYEHFAANSGSSAEDSHDCDICVFLDQLRSEQPQVHAAIVWHEFVSVVAALQPQFTHQATIGLHVARGPPANLG